VLVALLVPAAAAHAASIWTPINSGTTETISAIVYQSPTRFWYATTSGTIAYWNGSQFAPGLTAPGEQFNDLAMQPGGAVGLATTTNGHVWRTTNAGVSWSQLTAPTTRVGTPPCAGSPETSTGPETELNAVVWAGPANTGTVYLLGNDGTLLESTNAGASFTEINKNGSGTCAAQNDNQDQNLTDATFLPSAPADGLIVTQDFGALYDSSNGFASGHILSGGTVNSFQGDPRLAQDPSNPNLVWVVDHEPGGSGCGELCLMVSSDGGLNSVPARFANDTNPQVGLYDISTAGGTEVAAGSGGEIFTSIDGTDFYNQPADGALATENWRAEDAYDAAHAAVGGEGGALAVTGLANTIPDIIAPTGSISGPTTVNSGQPVTFTANVADNPGGSGINAGSLTWTVAGFPTQHGNTATYTFPRGTGFVTITLTFADNAGNQASTTQNVEVIDTTPAPTPAPNTKPASSPPSGSNPVTEHAGGATIVIYRIVFVTGRSGRYVPFTISSRSGRSFLAELLTVKGHHRMAASRATLKHGGRRTLHVGLPHKLKPGKYILRVRVSPIRGHGSRTVSVVVTLR